jgi:hypothetical protein
MDAQLATTIINIILAIVGIAGGVTGLIQWGSSIRTRKAEFVDRIFDKFRSDKINDTMYFIEYNRQWYNKQFHNGDKELERSVDELLSWLNYICYLKSTGNISDTEFKLFQYKINRTCKSRDIQTYLWNLFHFSKKNGTDSSFQYLIEYGISSGIFDTDFKSNLAEYSQYLKF